MNSTETGRRERLEKAKNKRPNKERSLRINRGDGVTAMHRTNPRMPREETKFNTKDEKTKSGKTEGRNCEKDEQEGGGEATR